MRSQEDCTYTPPPVLQFTHDQKRGYPVNLLKANGLICLALLCLLGGASIFDNRQTERNVVHADEITFGNPYGGVTLFSGKRNDVAVARTNPAGLVIVPDEASLDLTALSVAIDAYDVEVDSERAGAGLGASGVPLTGDYEPGLPPEKTFFEIPIPGRRLPDFPYSPNAIVMRRLNDHGILLNRDDVRRHTPRFPVRALKSRIDSAVVKLAVTIDERGNIKQLGLLEEDPTGYGFAEALLELHVIYRWRFTAPCIGGRAYGCTFSLTYVFCRDCPVDIRIVN